MNFTQVLDAVRDAFNGFNAGLYSKFERTQRLALCQPFIDKMRTGDKSYLRGYIEARTYEQDKRG